MSDRSIIARQKARLAEQAGMCCEYCRSPARYSVSSFSVEHIIPRIRGGTAAADNLAYSCQGCNNFKYTKISAIDPVTNTEVALYHPRRQHWGDHFAWNEDARLIIGITAVGRATVDALRLNREELINLRRVLFINGEHPPAEST